MKKLIVISGCLFAFACTNPEDNANMHTDSAGKNYSDDRVINSNPEAMDKNDQSGAGSDTSRYPTDSLGTNRPINKDSARKQ
jgi:hypothetical protein